MGLARLTVVPVPFSDGTTETLPEQIVESLEDYSAANPDADLRSVYEWAKATALASFIKRCSEHLKTVYSENPSKCPGVPAGTTAIEFDPDAVLRTLPDGYNLLNLHRKDTHGKDGKLQRPDPYLFGHPSGSKFRSSPEFYPHLTWLVLSDNHDPAECTCKYCPSWAKRLSILTAEGLPITPRRARAPRRSDGRSATNSPLPSSQPNSTQVSPKRRISEVAGSQESEPTSTPTGLPAKKKAKKSSAVTDNDVVIVDDVIAVDDEEPAPSQTLSQKAKKSALAAALAKRAGLMNVGVDSSPSDRPKGTPSVAHRGSLSTDRKGKSTDPFAKDGPQPGLVNIPVLKSFPEGPGRASSSQTSQARSSQGMQKVDIPTLDGFPGMRPASTKKAAPPLQLKEKKKTPASAPQTKSSSVKKPATKVARLASNNANVAQPQPQQPAQQAPQPALPVLPATLYDPRSGPIPKPHKPEPIYRVGEVVWVQAYLMLKTNSTTLPIRGNSQVHSIDIGCLQDKLVYWPGVICSVHSTEKTKNKAAEMAAENDQVFKKVLVPPLFFHATLPAGASPQVPIATVTPTHTFNDLNALTEYDARGYVVRLLNVTPSSPGALTTIMEQYLRPFAGYVLPRHLRFNPNVLSRLRQAITASDPLLMNYLLVVNKTYDYARSRVSIVKKLPHPSTGMGNGSTQHPIIETVQIGAEHLTLGDLVRINLPVPPRPGPNGATAQATLNIRVARLVAIHHAGTPTDPVTLGLKPYVARDAKFPYDISHATLGMRNGKWVIFGAGGEGKFGGVVEPEVVIGVDQVVGRFYPRLTGVDGWVGPRRNDGRVAAEPEELV
ncbi:uncharacterized protein EV422DRAFT_568407 [Fimicolochytrium jonesii]|uniref:uncharacterized protein n=1 Tax=Fimicolochytrium jonesii TaxID=1396493 RepID=UPI0022FE313E|nr:uncharacterized protein EV422DRAFT_568407 [Fimicolochytrium jonesii]KAI8819962.1 hypothetical protein EV422DRAFT_568407 [Fimicolochytrium jonesii]